MKKLFLPNRCPFEMLHIRKNVSDLFIILTIADKIFIYKYTTNTSSLTWRGCVTIFEPEYDLYVSSIHKPNIHEKINLDLSKWRIFFNSLFFSVKTAFLQISADFVSGFEKFLFRLKALETRMQIDANTVKSEIRAAPN